MGDLPELSNRKKLLLAFLVARANERVDPIRIMKGLFIFSQEAPDDWFKRDESYKFNPYLYGPFCQDIYNDLDSLVAKGLIVQTTLPGQSWSYYQPTRLGTEKSEFLKSEIHAKAFDYIIILREYVNQLSFKQLLTAIYKKYPEYTSKSIFKG